MLFSGFTFGLSSGLRSWFLGLLVVWCVLWGCLEVTMPLLEEPEAVDYSSDGLESIDIWAVTGGSSLDQIVDIPRLGIDGQVLGKHLGPTYTLSPSSCPVSSPVVHATAGSTSVQWNEGVVGASSWSAAGLTFPFSSPVVQASDAVPPAQWNEGLLGSSRWSDVGFPCLGFPASSLEQGFGLVDGREQVFVEECGLNLQGLGSSGDSLVEDWRVPLASAEQRGCGSPLRYPSVACQEEVGASVSNRVGVHGSSKGRRKTWIKKKLVRKYVVGEDLAWDNILKMSKCTLVGRVLGRNFSEKTIQAWASVSWSTHFGYVPEIELLNRGWFAINLQKEEDCGWLLSKCWHLDHSPVLMKPWNPLFDASKERVDIIPVWVKFPALPLHFWDMYHFRRIGDILGTFLEADLSFLETKVKKVARILVNLNIREGLAESIILEWGSDPITQILDYENIPFRCRRCHAYGHPAASCKFQVRRHNGMRRNGVREAFVNPFEKPPEVFGPSQSFAEELDSNMPVEELNIPISGVAEVNLVQPMQTSILVEDKAIGDPTDPGNPIPPLFANVNLFLNNVSLHGFDWIDGLRKLSLSGQSDIPFPFVSDEVLSGLGSHPVDPLSIFDPGRPLLVSTDSAFVHSSPLEDSPADVVSPVPTLCIEESCPSPSASMESGYFLRSCHKPVQGLGKCSSSVRKGRGRKTNLSKAQSRAREDLLGGTQISIEKALGAEKALKKGR